MRSIIILFLNFATKLVLHVLHNVATVRNYSYFYHLEFEVVCKNIVFCIIIIFSQFQDGGILQPMLMFPFSSHVFLLVFMGAWNFHWKPQHLKLGLENNNCSCRFKILVYLIKMEPKAKHPKLFSFFKGAVTPPPNRNPRVHTTFNFRSLISALCNCRKIQKLNTLNCSMRLEVFSSSR